MLFGLMFGTAFAHDDHLLITETVSTLTAAEYIEIYNPTGSPISLANYYLSDDEDYALLPGATGAGPAPIIDSFDFIVQFPAGAVISDGEVVVIAFDGAGFFLAYGLSANYEIIGTDGTPDMIATNVGSTRGLTNSGENVVLFFWDGAGDLVQDVDMTNIGTPSAANDIGNKTGVTVDGPDADTTPSAYAADVVTMPQQLSDPGNGFSSKRIALEGTNETSLVPIAQGNSFGGGNGITGDDETTENILVTFDGTQFRPFTAPDPGHFLPNPLPVELTHFEALTQGGDVLLQWATSSETNNAGFEIEAAQVVATAGQEDLDAEAWKVIGWTEGQGTTQSAQSYSFVAGGLTSGTFQFRLKQIDFDGAFDYSSNVQATLEMPGTHQLDAAYPNPFNPSTQFTLTVAQEQKVKVAIFDVQGRQVSTLYDGLLPANTATKFQFDASLLSSGIYLYRATGSSFAETRQVMLVK